MRSFVQIFPFRFYTEILNELHQICIFALYAVSTNYEDGLENVQRHSRLFANEHIHALYHLQKTYDQVIASKEYGTEYWVKSIYQGRSVYRYMWACLAQ